MASETYDLGKLHIKGSIIPYDHPPGLSAAAHLSALGSPPPAGRDASCWATTLHTGCEQSLHSAASGWKDLHLGNWCFNSIHWSYTGHIYFFSVYWSDGKFMGRCVYWTLLDHGICRSLFQETRKRMKKAQTWTYLLVDSSPDSLEENRGNNWADLKVI